MASSMFKVGERVSVGHGSTDLWLGMRGTVHAIRGGYITVQMDEGQWPLVMDEIMRRPEQKRLTYWPPHELRKADGLFDV